MIACTWPIAMSGREAIQTTDCPASANCTPTQNNRGEISTPKTWPERSVAQSSAVLLSPFGYGGLATTENSRSSYCSSESHHLVLDMSPSAVAESRSKKPECSYAVLIGIAMRAAQAANYGHRLPVMEIYRFIE